MPVSVEQYLEEFKKMNGEEAWQSEVTRLAVQAIKTGKESHITYWKELTSDFEWLDWDALLEAGEELPDNADMMMADLLKRQMPGIKSQAQYDAVTGALDAVRLVLNAILEQNYTQEAQGRKGLEMAFEAARQATILTDKLEEVPEAATSEASEVFKTAPAQFEEADIQKGLLFELKNLSTLAELNTWYIDTKPYRDRVVTSKLRNTLLDAIRAKKGNLS